MGSKDSSIFDYCNNDRQPTNDDVIEALRLNPKVFPGMPHPAHFNS